MIWMFKMNEVFWGDKPKVNEHYLFDTDDINFDVNMYDISLYFATSNYFILNESNDEEIYHLQFVGTNINPVRVLVQSNSVYYDSISEYYISKKRDNKLKDIGI